MYSVLEDFAAFTQLPVYDYDTELRLKVNYSTKDKFEQQHIQA